MWVQRIPKLTNQNANVSVNSGQMKRKVKARRLGNKSKLNVKNQLDINPTEVKNPKSKGTLEHEVDFEESRMFDGTISSIYGDDDVSAYYRASITLENSNPQYAK